MRCPAPLIAVLAAAFLALTPPADAEDRPWPQAETLQSELYFGMHSADGTGVSEQAWQRFLAETITPRFPDGLTVVEAHGQWRPASGPEAGEIIREETRLVIIVHPNTADAQADLAKIKDAYMQGFDQASVFHVDFPARIVD